MIISQYAENSIIYILLCNYLFNLLITSVHDKVLSVPKDFDNCNTRMLRKYKNADNYKVDLLQNIPRITRK